MNENEQKRGRLTIARPLYDQRGFTLIEIMVVVVILGILAAIVVPRLLSRPGEAKVTTVKVDMKSIEEAKAILFEHFYDHTTKIETIGNPQFESC